MHFWNHLRISQKIPALVVGCALMLGVVLGTVGYYTAANNARFYIEQRHSGIINARASELKNYLNSIAQDVRVLADTPFINLAMIELGEGWKQLGSNQMADLQAQYIDENPYPVGSKHELNISIEQNFYNQMHKKYHPWFRSLIKERGYYDAFLIDISGNVLYTVFKERDYASNVLTGQWKDTALGKVFQQVRAASKKGSVHFADYEAYAPSHGAPASFIATPIYDNLGDFNGVLVFQMPSDRINQIMQQRQGLGNTGEVIVVGRDGYLRSDSIFTAQDDTLKARFEHPSVVEAVKNGSSDGIIEGYRDGTYDLNTLSIDFLGTKWVLTLLQSVEEMDAPIIEMRNRMLLVVVGLLIVIGAVGFFASRAITRPISGLVNDMKKLAAGDLDIRLSGLNRECEIGDMVRAVAVFRDNDVEREQIARQKEENDRANDERQAQASALQAEISQAVAAATRGDFTRRLSEDYTDDSLINLAEQFNALLSTTSKGLQETGEVLSALACGDLTFRVEGHYEGAFGRLKEDTNALAEAFESIISEIVGLIRELRLGSREMAMGASDLSDRSHKQAAAMTETTATVYSVVEMVSKTARNAENASLLAAKAEGVAYAGGYVMKEMTAAMERISETSAQVTQIIGLINDIAFQTNLLALNASVEAARAGEAGRGFAVVAQEVRRLAQSAAEASRGIEQLVRQSEREVNVGVQLVERASGDLSGIVTSVQDVNRLMSGIALASSEQARNLSDLAIAVREVDMLAQQNGALVEQTRSTISSTEGKTEVVEGLLQRFSINEHFETAGNSRAA